jgi:hypothetical protein
MTAFDMVRFIKKEEEKMVDTAKTLMDFLPLLIPIGLLQLGLEIYALVNLYKRKKVRFDNKLVWIIIILFLNILGPILYLIFRGEDTDEEDNEGEMNG